jgi:hypothetical protein
VLSRVRMADSKDRPLAGSRHSQFPMSFFFLLDGSDVTALSDGTFMLRNPQRLARRLVVDE